MQADLTQTYFPIIYSSLFYLIISSVDEIVNLFFSVVENNGVEPLTSCVQGRRSSQLS